MDRGDICQVKLKPIQGREQAGSRYVIIISPREFNRLGTPLVCPIMQGVNSAVDDGFAVSLSGAGTTTQGVVRCNRPRVLDFRGRTPTLVEKVPHAIIDKVTARLRTLLEWRQVISHMRR